MEQSKRDRAEQIIRMHIGYAASAALVPIPGADIAAVGAVQLDMLRQIAGVYDIGFMDSLGKNIITSLVGGSIARLGASLIKAIPGFGTIVGELTMPVMASISTYSMGQIIVRHLENGGTMDNLDLRASKKKVAEVAKEDLEKFKKEAPADVEKTDVITQLKRMSELHQSGILSDEEFEKIKAKLIAQM